MGITRGGLLLPKTGARRICLAGSGLVKDRLVDIKGVKDGVTYNWYGTIQKTNSSGTRAFAILKVGERPLPGQEKEEAPVPMQSAPPQGEVKQVPEEEQEDPMMVPPDLVDIDVTIGVEGNPNAVNEPAIIS